MKAFSGELNFHNRVTGNGETDTDSMLAANNLVTEKISGKIEFLITQCDKQRRRLQSAQGKE